MILEEITGPEDLRGLGYGDLDRLASEIRDFLVDAVSRTGGHLGSNLGVVELTLAMHRVFDSPRDQLIFDTGHQAYVHKLVTGRREGFAGLRQQNGLSGYPNRRESEHDLIENSHASTGLSYALAVATAKRLRGQGGKTVVVVGDGALTGGMAYEALNNIGQLKPEMIIVLNDNGRSYAPTIGGVADNLAHLRISPKYEHVKDAAAGVLRRLPAVGETAYDTAKRMKNSLKQLIAPMSVFEALGLKYAGPVDGHDIRDLERVLHDASLYKGPVVVHVVTEKGRGYGPAEADEIDRFHGVAAFDPATGTIAKKAPSWTDLFGDALVELAEKDDRIVAITAAMASSTGLLPFMERFPDRFFDVGIAEQHAVTFAAGLAMRGLRPVVCIYSTFLQRAFDQVECDAALHRAPVLFVVDRAGITGDDGASHHGMLDLAYLRVIPGMTVSAPSDPDEMRRLLATGLAFDGPFSIRIPRGGAPGDGTAGFEPIEVGRMRVLREGDDLLLAGIGKTVGVCLAAADLLERRGVGCTVVDARFVKPLDPRLAALAGRHRAMLTVEDGTVCGGFGSAVLEAMAAAGVAVPTRVVGLPDAFIEHGSQASLLHAAGLDAGGIEAAALSMLGGAPAAILAG